MPTFDFSAANKKNTKNNKTKTIKDKIILSNVTGIVVINKLAEYKVVLEDNSIYNIHPDCYSCKGKEIIYRQGENDLSHYIYIRNFGECNNCDSNYWLPFNVGCIVKGNLLYVSSENNTYFMIKDCDYKISNEQSINAIKFYREHIKEINNIIRNRRVI